MRVAVAARVPAPDADLESLVYAGRAAEVLETRQGAAASGLPPQTAFLLGLAAEAEDRPEESRELFRRAFAAPDPTRLRAAAHLALLDHHDGRFGGDAQAYVRGLRRAEQARVHASGIAAAECELAVSINLLALNRGRDALERALLARRLSASADDPVARRHLRFQIAFQLTHVWFGLGRYLDAFAEAESAVTIARALGAPQARVRASYLRGIVRIAKGEAAGMAYLRDARDRWPYPGSPFGRWLLQRWAVAARDLGDVERVAELRAEAAFVEPWEEPLFELADRRPAAPLELTGPDHERPFRNATRGLMLFLAGSREAEPHLDAATREFEWLGLRHYMRGTALALAAARLAAGDDLRALRAVERESVELERYGLMRWPWWHPTVARRLGDFCRRRGIAPGYWHAALATLRPSVPVRPLLQARGLSEREIDVVLRWIAEPTLTRRALAAALGIHECTVRTHLTSARHKLSCGSRRGAAPLRERIGELAFRAPLPIA